jgi:hypothetical protein
LNRLKPQDWLASFAMSAATGAKPDNLGFDFL